MKTSRAVFSEVQKKAGHFPFTLRSLEDEKRSRMGVSEAVAHGLLKPYDIVKTAAGTVVAEFFFTSTCPCPLGTCLQAAGLDQRALVDY